ncbi:MAG: 50S ribosomal protein L34e [archaeon]
MAKTPRSKAKRKLFKRSPGGTVRIQYVCKKPAKAKCAECGKVLAGVPRERPFKMQNMAKSKKRPERPDGGCLCSPCSRKKIIAKTRQ